MKRAVPERAERRARYEVVGFVLEGNATLELEGQTIKLKPGDSWVVPKAHSTPIISTVISELWKRRILRPRCIAGTNRTGSFVAPHLHTSEVEGIGTGRENGKPHSAVELYTSDRKQVVCLTTRRHWRRVCLRSTRVLFRAATTCFRDTCRHWSGYSPSQAFDRFHDRDRTLKKSVQSCTELLISHRKTVRGQCFDVGNIRCSAVLKLTANAWTGGRFQPLCRDFDRVPRDVQDQQPFVERVVGKLPSTGGLRLSGAFPSDSFKVSSMTKISLNWIDPSLNCRTFPNSLGLR